MMLLTWVILPIVFVIIVGIYLYKKIASAVRYFGSTLSLKKQRIVIILLFLVIVLPAVRIYSVYPIILLHFAVLLFLTDVVVFVIRKIKKKQEVSHFWKSVYKSGVIAAVITAIMIGYGNYNIYQIHKTQYTIETEKSLRQEGYKIVLLSDLHYGITLDKKQLSQVVERINKENADIVVLDGDLVDESTSYSQMKEAFETLGQIKSAYGIYYVYGNHDQNDYALHPNYTKEQLANVITKANIKILEDQVTTINNEISLIGRKDQGDGSYERDSIHDLVEILDAKTEWIVLDHQPTDYSHLQEAGCDLVLSGHTHAG